MSKQVLIVDDDPVILMAFKSLLESPEVKVETADEITRAESMLKSNSYNVVITDLRLSGVLGEEGLELINYVKEHNPDTKVILVTGYGSPTIRTKAFDLGVAYYFEKPVAGADLKEALRSLGVE